MSKADAWDVVYEIVIDGINCWDSGSEDECKKNLAYLTGVIEGLGEAVRMHENEGKT